METKIKIDIFGSCVSRDVLEYQGSRKLEINNYIARQSLISAVSKSVEINENQLNIDSLFQKRMILYDFRKDTFQVLRENKGDYLMIDLIDERFPLVCIDNSYVTFSNELSLSGYIKSPKIMRCKKSSGLLNFIFRKTKWLIGQDKVDVYIHMFCNKLMEIYSQEQIVIHEVYLQNQYLDSKNQIKDFDNNTIGYNNRINEYYRYLYQTLKKIMPHAYYILLSNNYVADEKHKWGLSSMHFQAEYYADVLDKLNGFIKGIDL